MQALAERGVLSQGFSHLGVLSNAHSPLVDVVCIWKFCISSQVSGYGDGGGAGNSY